MQSVECAAKITANGRIAGSKRQIGEALCTIAERKNQWIRKNTKSQEKLLRPVNKMKAIIAICIAFTVFFLRMAVQYGTLRIGKLHILHL